MKSFFQNLFHKKTPEEYQQLFKEKITTYGGVLNQENDILFDFSNSGIAFQTLSKITFQIDFMTNDLMGQLFKFDGGHIYIKLYIDNELHQSIRITNDTPIKEKTFTIEANKQVKIIKVSEARLGVVCIRNLLDKKIQSIQKEDKVKVEFIGASLVSGYGNDHPDNKMHHTDWQKGWCSLLCEHYNWEAMVHSYSGFGLVKDGGGNRKEQIMERRRRILGTDKNSKFDFTSFKASYVIMNIGTNDFAGVVEEPFKTEWLNKMKELIYELQENYGKNVKIIIIHGPMMNETVRDVIREIPQLFNDEEETKKNIFILSMIMEMNEDNEKDIHWGFCYHPTELGHKVMAEQIIQQLQQIVENQ